jgi:hypothetical protein
MSTTKDDRHPEHPPSIPSPHSVLELLDRIEQLNEQITAYMRDNATICYQCGTVLPPNTKLSGGADGQ